MTLEEFEPVFRDLAIALTHPVSADEIRVYFGHLRPLSLPAVEQAAHGLARSSTFWPKVSEWCAIVNDLERQQQQIARETMLRRGAASWHQGDYYCLDCEDTGWMYADCPRVDCGFPRAHLPHRFVRRCPCRETNPIYQRHHIPGGAAEHQDPPRDDAKATLTRLQAQPKLL